MRPETDATVSGRPPGDDDGDRVRPDGGGDRIRPDDDGDRIRPDGGGDRIRPDGGGTARPGTAEVSGFDERHEGWISILSAVAVLSGLMAVLGVETSTYVMETIDVAAAEPETSALLGVAGGNRLGLVTASIAARIVRDLSLVAGGVAIVLGCWVAFAGVIRVAGRS